MKNFNTPSILLAGLMALAGVAHAQTAADTSNVPSKAGEPSTMTKGVPNAMTTNTNTNTTATGADAPATSKSQIRQDAKGRDAASATTNSPGRAGEASTMVRGNPNANPDAPTLTKSKSERRMEKEMKKAQRKQEREIAVMGQRGGHAPLGTSPNTPAGNPSALEGGTPK